MVVVGVSVVVESNTMLVTWAAAANGDTGKPVDVSMFPTLTVQATTGTIGTSTLQGSNDGVTWGAIGAGVTLAAGVVTVVSANPKYVRPNFGAGATGAVVVLNAARNG